MTLKHSEFFPEAEIICKYFTGRKERRFGDVQSARPAPLWDGLPGKYRTESENGFVNITFDDAFLIRHIALLASAGLPKVPEPESIGPAYRDYVFSNDVHDIWEMTCAEQIPEGIVLSFPWRRLYVMAFFLSELAKEKSPQGCGPFSKLYALFAKELYEALCSVTLRSAPPCVKNLTAAALRIRAFQEA